MTVTQVLLLVFGCLGGIGGMVAALENWQLIYEPAFIGGALVNIAAHVAAALTPPKPPA